MLGDTAVEEFVWVVEGPGVIAAAAILVLKLEIGENAPDPFEKAASSDSSSSKIGFSATQVGCH